MPLLLEHVCNNLKQVQCVPEAKSSVCLWGRDRQLELVVVHGDLGVEGGLMVQVCVHLQACHKKVWKVHSHLGNEFQANRRHERQLPLQEDHEGKI